MKTFKKIIKFSFIFSIISFIIIMCGGIIFYHTTTNGLALNHEILNERKIENAIMVFDSNGNQITKPKQSFIKLSKLASHTKDAFISAEDKRFYSHKGLDFVRMGKAVLSNLKSGSFSQGASTISQQLIKNTQLSNEKTLTRKLKEMKLTKELEKIYSKNEILEMYLNNIYFGNGCYGIESASQYYFSKSADNLSLSESALLAATINAPTIFNPKENPENNKVRRNLILKLMQNNGKISEIDCKNAQNEEILLNLQNLNNNNFLYNQVINEAENLLNLSREQLYHNNYKIYTNLDSNLTSKINSAIKNNYPVLPKTINISSIVIDNYSNKIISITGSNSSFTTKVQPGSTIKPILVFAPAIEKGQISPATKILDEPVNFSGYSPKNSNECFHGFVSVRESLKNSYNVPAVKILNELGISEAQNFAKKLGIDFSENDNNLAIALGGFTEGITTKSIADAYTAFANNGNFKVSSIITKITKNGNIIYRSDNKKEKVMKDSTAYLITDMLLDTSKTGTAKRLKDFDFQIASKTGTVGYSNSKLNKDCFNVSYTTKHTILTHISGENMPENINGSTYPTMITRDILSILYQNSKPKNFSKPNSITTLNLNKNNYEENKITIDNSKQNSLAEIFDKSNIPTNLINNFQISITNKQGLKPIIEFNLPENYSYQIIRKNKNEEEIISSSSNENFIKFEDKTANINNIYEYFVKFCDFYSNTIIESNHIIIKTF